MCAFSCRIQKDTPKLSFKTALPVFEFWINSSGNQAVRNGRGEGEQPLLSSWRLSTHAQVVHLAGEVDNRDTRLQLILCNIMNPKCPSTCGLASGM